MNSHRKVFLTEHCLVTSLGTTISEFEAAMFSGASGVKALSRRAGYESFPVPYSGYLEETRDNGGSAGAWQAIQIAELLFAKLCQSISTKQLKFDAILCGTRTAATINVALQVLREKKWGGDLVGPVTAESIPEIAAKMLADSGHIPPPASRQICLVNACVAGSAAIGDAFHRIRSGEWERALACAVELDCNPMTMISLYLLGALATKDIPPEQASAPFSPSRSGFVKAEAAGALVLESEEAALARGANILAEVVGFASTTDAWDLTLSRKDLSCSVAAIQMAISDAGISPNEVDYINSHGTGTPQGDQQECLAIKQVFGAKAHQIPVSSLKSQLGHSTVACGLVEAIATALMLKAQKIAPTINFQPGDEICDLDFVANKARAVEMRYAISNNFGFGGQNTCLVLKPFGR